MPPSIVEHAMRCDVMLNFIKMGLTFVQRSLVMICSNLTNCSGEGETQKMKKKNLHFKTGWEEEEVYK